MKVVLEKMLTEHVNPIQYFFCVNKEKVLISDLIGKQLKMVFSGNMFCIKCGRKIKKTFGQGFCYPCFANAPENEECVLRPELCRAHEGTARDMDYAREHCLADQIVYLASSESIKVGVTRKTQIPYRWIDQGASFAKIIAITPNRYTAGCLEVEIKKYLPDKTNWRSMLINNVDAKPDFLSKINLIKQILPAHLLEFLVEDPQVYEFEYPVFAYPQKVTSLDFDKDNIIEGKLEGIKGQYFIFNRGRVINIRKYSGYEIEIESL